MYREKVRKRNIDVYYDSGYVELLFLYIYCEFKFLGF